MTANGFNGSLDALIAAAQGADASLNPANGITVVALSQCGATAIDTGRPLILLVDTAPNAAHLPGRLGAGWELLTRLYGADRVVTLLPSGRASTVAACASDGVGESQAIYLAGLEPLDAFATPWTMPWLSARLRAPDGCPWDREQTHSSLAKHLIEEAWELHDAIAALESASEADRPRAIADLAEELGDVLLQVVLHAQIAQERGDFDLADVQDGLARKIVRRHPHVFGDASAATTRDVQRNWEAIKAGERAAAGEGEKPKGALDGVSRGLPALSASRELQDRASAVGYDWPTLDGVRAKITEELAELDEALAEAGHPDQITSTQASSAAALAHAQEELGDVLAVIVNLGRRSGIDAEAALRGANDKFRRRFAEVERRAATRGISLKDADFTTLDALWDEAKAAEREAKG
uniref:nucleoside triphosphate pyrophosphohydrolase n=1 Tax=Candidatus Limnocylindrus sp. TaxID=2802978 RepID=UPI00404AA420